MQNLSLHTEFSRPPLYSPHVSNVSKPLTTQHLSKILFRYLVDEHEGLGLVQPCYKPGSVAKRHARVQNEVEDALKKLHLNERLELRTGLDIPNHGVYQIKKDHLVDALSFHFNVYLTKQAHAENNRVHQDGSQQTIDKPERLRKKRKGKTKVNNSRNDQNDDDGDDANRHGKKPKNSDGSDADGRKFACPFAKRYPRQNSSCVTRGFERTFRVKEHLRRNHLTIQCPRCGREFDEENDLAEHHRSDQTCERVDYRPCLDAINQEQERALKNRTGLSSMDEHAKWLRIYEIVFPDAEEPYPSPYLEAGPMSEPFIDFIQRELPSRISNAVGMLLNQTTTFDAFGGQAIQEMVSRTLNDLRGDYGQPSGRSVLPLSQPEEPSTLMANPVLDQTSETGHSFLHELVNFDEEFIPEEQQGIETQAPFSFEYIPSAAAPTNALHTLPDSGYDSYTHIDLNDAKSVDDGCAEVDAGEIYGDQLPP